MVLSFLLGRVEVINVYAREVWLWIAILLTILIFVVWHYYDKKKGAGTIEKGGN